MKRGCVILCLICCAGLSRGQGDIRDGDIIFHTSRSAQSLAVQKATRSPHSHMGLILFRDGQPFVFEAVSTAKYTPLNEWIDRGVGGRFVTKRLANADDCLTSSAVAQLHRAAEKLAGLPYDRIFGWSDDRLYCSELVWKTYYRALGIRLTELQKLREFDLSDPAVKTKLRERYGNKPPLDENVVSPVAIFNSPSLVAVQSHIPAPASP